MINSTEEVHVCQKRNYRKNGVVPFSRRYLGMWKFGLVVIVSSLLVLGIGRPDRVSCARIVEDDYFMDGPPLYMSEERMSEGRDILILNGLWQFMPVEGGVDAPGAFEHLPDVESDKWLDIFVPMELPDSFFAECGV
jgi:hypothetical protein